MLHIPAPKRYSYKWLTTNIFTNSAEVPYGISCHSFNSLNEAEDQASISRLYGGIHFITAIEKGKIEGRAIGAFVVEKLK